MGKKRSPIDIIMKCGVQETMPYLRFRGFTNRHAFTTLINVDGSVKVTLNDQAFMSGGPLDDTYTFDHLEFHWGANDNEGSEHTIDGKRYPLEAQLIFSKENNIKEKEGKSFAAVALLFQRLPNPPTYSVFTYLSFVSNPGEKITIDGNIFSDFFDALKPFGYATYIGSLTVEPYAKKVKWIVYTDPLSIKPSQISCLRHISSGKGLVNRNWQETQNMHKRTIKIAIDQIAEDMSIELLPADVTNEEVNTSYN